MFVFFLGEPRKATWRGLGITSLLHLWLPVDQPAPKQASGTMKLSADAKLFPLHLGSVFLRAHFLVVLKGNQSAFLGGGPLRASAFWSRCGALSGFSLCRPQVAGNGVDRCAPASGGGGGFRAAQPKCVSQGRAELGGFPTKPTAAWRGKRRHDRNCFSAFRLACLQGTVCFAISVVLGRG